MANHVSALKRYRQSQKRRLRNKSYKSSINTSAKKIFVALEANDMEAAKEHYQHTIARLDSAANKGVLHQKTVSRKISRLTKKYNAAISQ